MYRMSVYVPMFVLRILYFAVFYTNLIYGISVWRDCDLTNINKIKNRQHKALRMISKNDNSLSSLPLKSVYHFRILSKFQSIIHNGNSQYFQDKILSLTMSINIIRDL